MPSYRNVPLFRKRRARAFDAALPYRFKNAIISASSNEERTRLATVFGMDPRVEYESVLSILELIREQDAVDAALLHRYAGVMLQVFVRHRARMRREGFEIEATTYDGRKIFSKYSEVP